MSLTITPETKNTLNLTNEAIFTDVDWASPVYTWDSLLIGWDAYSSNLVLNTKSTLSLTLETKN